MALRLPVFNGIHRFFGLAVCYAKDAGSFKYQSIIDHALMAGRITIFGTAHFRWSSTYSGSFG